MRDGKTPFPGRPSRARLFLGLFPAVFLSWQASADARQLPPQPAKPRFDETGIVSTNEGHATLHWSLPGNADPGAPGPMFELEQSSDPAFGDGRLRHRGPESAFFVSGLSGGRTYFRVRAVPEGSAPGPWSESLVVQVDYPGRGQVAFLLAVGCLVFLGTIVAIVAGWLSTRPRGRVEHEAGA